MIACEKMLCRGMAYTDRSAEEAKYYTSRAPGRYNSNVASSYQFKSRSMLHDPSILGKFGVTTHRRVGRQGWVDVENSLTLRDYPLSKDPLMRYKPGDSRRFAGSMVKYPAKETVPFTLHGRIAVPIATMKGIGVNRFETPMRNPQAPCRVEKGWGTEIFIGSRTQVKDAGFWTARPPEKPLDQSAAYPPAAPKTVTDMHPSKWVKVSAPLKDPFSKVSISAEPATWVPMY